MVIKTVFKSHFKIKRNFNKNSKKKIFVKNMAVFLLFTKIFFTNCTVNFFFTKDTNTNTNVLKAPSRHKKFFHQIFYEYFLVKINFFFSDALNTENLQKCAISRLGIFNEIDTIFKKIGSNTLSRSKMSISFIHLIRDALLFK